MILYDYLFYCSYKMGMRSGNFEGVPALAGMMMVIPNAGIHIATIQIILQGLGFDWFDNLIREKVWGRLFCLVFFALMYWYYFHQGRYKKLIEKYNSRRSSYWQRHPFVTILVYTLGSFILFGIVVAIKKSLT